MMVYVPGSMPCGTVNVLVLPVAVGSSSAKAGDGRNSPPGEGTTDALPARQAAPSALMVTGCPGSADSGRILTLVWATHATREESPRQPSWSPPQECVNHAWGGFLLADGAGGTESRDTYCNLVLDIHGTRTEVFTHLGTGTHPPPDGAAKTQPSRYRRRPQPYPRPHRKKCEEPVKRVTNNQRQTPRPPPPSRHPVSRHAPTRGDGTTEPTSAPRPPAPPALPQASPPCEHQRNRQMLAPPPHAG